MVFNFSWVVTFYTCRICKEMRWKEIPKFVCALEDRVYLASNILGVQEHFFSNEEITKMAKRSMKTDRLTSVGLMNIHRDIVVDYDEVTRLFFQLHRRKFNQKNLVFQKFKLILRVIYTMWSHLRLLVQIYITKIYKTF